MSGLTIKWLIAVSGFVALAIFFRWLYKKQQLLEQHFQRRFAGRKIVLMDKTALYVARQSDGYSHFRGMGYLVLTKEELFFERQMDNKVISIPIHSIIEVGETRRLGGQNPGPIMLKVDFRSPRGQEDAIAWSVKNKDQWVREISALTSHNAT